MNVKTVSTTWVLVVSGAVITSVVGTDVGVGGGSGSGSGNGSGNGSASASGSASGSEVGSGRRSEVNRGEGSPSEGCRSRLALA